MHTMKVGIPTFTWDLRDGTLPTGTVGDRYISLLYSCSYSRYTAYLFVWSIPRNVQVDLYQLDQPFGNEYRTTIPDLL
jgi:hypothetical protein